MPDSLLKKPEALVKVVNSQAYKNLHEAIIVGSSSEKVLNQVVSAALELTTASECALFVYPDDPAARDRYFQMTRESPRVRQGHIDLKERIREQTADDVLVLPEPFAKRFLVPIRSTSTALGALTVKPGLPETEAETLHALAEFAAMAIAKVKSVEEAKREAAILEKFLDNSRLLLSVGDEQQPALRNARQEALRNIAEVACRNLEADLVVLYDYSGAQAAFELPPIEFGERLSKSWLLLAGDAGQARGQAFHKILDSGQPQYMSDARKWLQQQLIADEWSEETRDFLEKEEILSSAGIPIRAEGEILGLMFLNYRWRRHFGESFKVRAEAVADLASLAIRNSTVLRKQHETMERLEVLTEIGTRLSEAATEGEDQILRVIYEQTSRVMNVENLYISFFDSVEDRVSFKLAVEDDESLSLGEKEWTSRVGGDGLSEWVINQGRPELIPCDVEAWMREHGVRQYGRLPKSWVGAPLITGGEVLGMIGVQSYTQPNAFDPGHCRVLSTIAEQASIALYNARSYDRVVKRAEERSRLEESARSALRKAEELARLEQSALHIALSTEIHPRLEIIVKLAAELLGAKGGKIYLKNRANSELVLEAVHGLDSDRFPLGSTLAIGQGMAGQVAREGKPLIVNDYSKYKNHIPELADLFSAVVEVPLKRMAGFSGIQDAETIGVLSVFDDKNRRSFAEADVSILEQFGLRASVVIQGGQRLNDLRAINQIGNDLLKKVRLKEELLEEIATQVAKTLKCNHCTLFFVRTTAGRRQLVPEVTYGRSDQRTVERTFEIDEGLLGLVYEREKTVNFNDAAKEPAFVAGKGRGFAAYHERSILIAPIEVDGEIIALVSADHEGLNCFDDWDVELVDILAHQAGVAIKDSELWGEETRARHQLTSMLEISRILARALVSGTRGLAETFESFYEQVNHVIDAPSFFLALYDSESRILDFSNYYHFGERVILSEPRRLIDDDRGLTEHVIRKAETLFVRHRSKQTEAGELPAEGIDLVEPSAQSLILVPLVSRGAPIGVISVQHEQPGRYTRADQKILEMIADRTAVAIDNVLLYDGINQQLETTSRKIADAEKLILSHSLRMDVLHRIPNLIGTIPHQVKQVKFQLEGHEGLSLSQRKSMSGKLDGVCHKVAEFLSFVGDWNPLDEKPMSTLAQSENLVESAWLRLEVPDSIKTEMSFAETLPGVRCDPRLLYEAFHHVITNAVESMADDKEGLLRFEAKEVAGEKIYITIADSGKGIPPEQLTRIFDLFYSAKLGKGFGYGLWRAKCIVEAAGGSIQADSQVGGGSTFLIQLPAATQ